MNNGKTTHVSKVGFKTDPLKLASSVQLSLQGGDNVEILAMGKEACFIANKAICIIESFSKQNRLELNWKPSYKTVLGDEDRQPRSVMSWLVWI